MNDCHCQSFLTKINARDNKVVNKLPQFIFYDDIVEKIVSFIFWWDNVNITTERYIIFKINNQTFITGSKMMMLL